MNTFCKRQVFIEEIAPPVIGGAGGVIKKKNMNHLKAHKRILK